MPMKSLLLAAATLAALATPAHAIDCRKASTAIEHGICDSQSLKAADAALGQAYGQILKPADGDAEVHAMLVASQKRWLAARDEAFADPKDEHWGDENPWRGKLLNAIRSRTEDLGKKSAADPKQFDLVARVLQQRQFTARFTGGAFAGFATGCEFLPGSRESWADSYGCFGTRSYQNNNRVCSVSEDWATYAVYETRTVADVVDGKLKTVATCSVGGNGDDSACPDADDTSDSGARWNLQPKAGEAGASAAPPALAKIDAEAGGAEDDQPWLRACLTDTGYPAADPTSDGSRK
ncbi:MULTISPECIES: lysozyme inhibitor LprI family protein [unclassified Inquilinus]|uniref:lysozyme inhibitor LprI family protein n=1 Tax=unclassified Inquilinus TaxID=2645927 RepID=UPI003F8F2A65